MQNEYSIYFNIDNFFLSIVILLCIVLSLLACILTWFKNVEKSLKFAFIYLIIILLIYQTSTLLCFYSSQKQFELLIGIKTCAALLLKTAFLFFVAVNIRAPKLVKLFFGIHILSFTVVFLFFSDIPYRASVISITGSNAAQYESSTQAYTIASSLLFIVAGIMFYFSNRLFRKKRRYLIFLLMFIALNIGILSLSVFASNDAVHEKMYILIFLMLLAFLFRSTPFYEKKDSILSTSNIIHATGETVVILDREGKIDYMHCGFDSVDISLFIDEVFELIDKQNNTPIQLNNDEYKEAEAFIEGVITITSGKKVHLNYKLSPLFYKKTYIGRIIVLRDITVYNELIDELNEKSTRLKDALEKQKEYIHITQRLISQEEHVRILEMVNSIAGEYLNTLKSKVARLEDAVEAESILKDGVMVGNEEMLALTKKAIEEIRRTVKQLHVKDEGGIRYDKSFNSR